MSTQPTRYHDWKFDREVNGTRIDTITYEGRVIHRLRDVTGLWNDEYAIVHPVTKKLVSYATLGSAKRNIDKHKGANA